MSKEKHNTNDATTNTADHQQIVVFKLGQEEYGLHIDQIKEVVIAPDITILPLSPPFIKGVANIRGNIIAILDLLEKFKLTDDTRELEGNSFVLVIESEEYKMGVLVKEVPNTLSIPSSCIEEAFFRSDHQDELNYITGIAKLDKRLIILIDIFQVFDKKEVGQILKKQALAVGAV